MHLLNHGQHIAKLPARVQFSSLAQTNAELNEALTCCSADEIILTESKRSDKADLFTQFSNIVCLECSEEYSDAEDFLIHILRCQFGERHVRLYRKLGVVSIRAQQLLQEAQRARAAYVGRTLSDKPSLSIITPANSRLAPFLLAGTTLSVNCPAPMFCEKCIMDPFGNRVSIYFSVNTIKKLQDDIDDYHEMRRKKKEMREYVKLLRNFELKIPDIMDTRNDLEVSRLLESATGIPAGTRFIPTRSISVLVSEVFPHNFVSQDDNNIAQVNGVVVDVVDPIATQLDSPHPITKSPINSRSSVRSLSPFLPDSVKRRAQLKTHNLKSKSFCIPTKNKHLIRRTF